MHEVAQMDYFNGLETHHKRVKFYKQNFNIIEPQEIYLGKSLSKQRGKVVCKKTFGIFTPFRDCLQAMLSLPEVWHYVQHPRVSMNSIMNDVCDGYLWNQNSLFSRNVSA